MKIISTVLLMVAGYATLAQDFNKSVPVKLDRIDIYLYANNDFTKDFTARKELVNNSGKLTAAQFTKAMTLTNESSFPEGMNTPQKQLMREKEILNYKAYWQGSWLQTNPAEGWAQKLHLIWLPSEENQHMPDDLKPKNKDGIFLIIANRGFSLNSLPKPSVPSALFIESMKKKHTKKEPMSIDSAWIKVLSSYGESMQFSYDELVVKGQYSDDEFKRIAELATVENWPKALSTGKFDDAHDKAYRDVSKYKAYKIAVIYDNFIKGILYWIPKEDNKHMPPDMQPLKGEGFFIVSKIEEKNDPYLTYLLRGNTPAGRVGRDIAGRPKPNSSSLATSSVNIVASKNEPSTPTIVATTTPESKTGSPQSGTSSSVNQTNSYTTSSGIQVSTGVDMSAFTNNSRLGTIMLYYGYEGKASSIYMYELRGKSLSDKQAVVSKLRDKISVSTPFIGFEWLPGYDCNSAKGYVYKKTSSTNGTNCKGEFKIN